MPTLDPSSIRVDQLKAPHLSNSKKKPHSSNFSSTALRDTAGFQAFKLQEGCDIGRSRLEKQDPEEARDMIECCDDGHTFGISSIKTTLQGQCHESVVIGIQASSTPGGRLCISQRCLCSRDFLRFSKRNRYTCVEATICLSQFSKQIY